MMPVLFLGHGNPMNALENNEWTTVWQELGRTIPRPEAVLCISAHWEDHGTKVTGQQNPRTIHDFFGFPEELYTIEYPAPGSPETARKVTQLLGLPETALDDDWGFDHGAWSLLKHIYPDASVPVIQLALDRSKTAEEHYKTGQLLQRLRNEHVLILGSGNIIHNLHSTQFMMAGGYDWAHDFRDAFLTHLQAGDAGTLADYRQKLPHAREAHPSEEHYFPFLYCLGAAGGTKPARIFCDDLVYGSLSMMGMLWES